MRTISMIILSLIMSMLPCAAQGSDPLSEANKAYNANHFEQAVRLYSSAIDSTGGNSGMYYNLGNALYRTGNLGKAIIAYERALKLDPTNEDARANLGFINSKIADRPGERGTLLSQVTDTVLDSATPNTWAWITFLLFMVTLGSVAAYVISSSVTLRKVGFFGGIVMLVLTCIGIFLSVRAGSRVEAYDEAIVTATTTILSSEPSAPSTEAEKVMVLHEGAKVEIVDSIVATTDSARMWLDVYVDNATRAWVNADDVERI